MANNNSNKKLVTLTAHDINMIAWKIVDIPQYQIRNCSSIPAGINVKIIHKIKY